MTTFEDWHNAHAKYMEPADIAHWCRDAYEAGRTSRDSEVADLSGVILCHAEQVTLLRDAIKPFTEGCWSRDLQVHAREALAATADLKDVILCHAKPMAWTYDKGPIIDVGAKIPLYRAWEPTK